MTALDARAFASDNPNARNRHGGHGVPDGDFLSLAGILADDVLVMFAGAAVERGCTRQVLARPRHPSTDEDHLLANRATQRDELAGVMPILAEVLDVALPDAGFYLWAKVRGSVTEFAYELFALYDVTTLPGIYLAREVNGLNPGAHRIRMAMVAVTAEREQAVQRSASDLRGAA